MINKTNNGAVIHIDNIGLKHYYSNSRRRQLYNYLESIKSKHGLTKIRLSTAMGMSEKYLANKAGECEFSKFGDLERQTYSSIRSEVECAVLLLTDLSLVDSDGYSQSNRFKLLDYANSVCRIKNTTKAELSKAMGKTKSYINVMSSENQLKKIGDITLEQLDGIKFKIDSIDAHVPDSVISIKKPPNILSRDDVLRVLREKLNYSHAQYVGDHIILTDDKL